MHQRKARRDEASGGDKREGFDARMKEGEVLYESRAIVPSPRIDLYSKVLAGTFSIGFLSFNTLCPSKWFSFITRLPLFLLRNYKLSSGNRLLLVNR